MKKLAKNIPTHYNFPGTPIFRDTTALPFADGGPLHDRDINGNLLNSTYASPLGNMYREGGPFGEDQGTFDYASSVYASQPGNYFKDGGQFQGKYSLPEDSFKQGGNNLHNSVYASSPQQYPAVYNFGGTLGDNLSTRQQMYMPLDHITRTGGSILSMSNTPQMEGEGKDLVYDKGGPINSSGQPYFIYGDTPNENRYIRKKGVWHISNKGTNFEYVPIKDPDHKRTLELERNAKYVAPEATKSGIESTINKYLGSSMDKASRVAEQVSNPGDDPVDNFRHPMAGRYAAEEIEKRTGNIPYVSNALGFLGSTALGIGHEAATIFGDKRSWPTKLMEAGEDIYNNTAGAKVGASSMTPKQKTDYLLYLSNNNMLPDGVVSEPGTGPHTMYFKKDPDDKVGSYNSSYKREGGSLDISYDKGGQIYTYAGRPGAEYQKGANGWEIRTEHTNGFVPVKDPTGKRTALLNAQAKPLVGKSAYERLVYTDNNTGVVAAKGGFLPQADNVEPNKKKYRTKVTDAAWPKDTVLTYKDDADYINGIANFQNILNPGVQMNPEFNDQIKAQLYKGNYGFNPATGELVKLTKSEKVPIRKEDAAAVKTTLKDIGNTLGSTPEETKTYYENQSEQKGKEYANKFNENKVAVTIPDTAAWVPNFQFQGPTGMMDTSKMYGQTVYMTPEEADEFNNLSMHKSMTETMSNPLLYVPGMVASAGLSGLTIPTVLEGIAGLGAKSLPFMSTVPGATVGNLVNSGFIANSLYNSPQNARDWYDVSQGNKDWTDAALGTGEIALGMLGSGAGLKSIAQDVSQGSKYASKALGTETGLLSNMHKINPVAGKLGKYNRVVGQDAIADLQNSGVVRAGSYGGVDRSGLIRTTPFPSFGKGTPSNTYIQQTLQQGKTPYIISTDRAMGTSTLGRHGKNATLFPVDDAGRYLESFPASEAKLFNSKPHWLKGYPEISKKIGQEQIVPDFSNLNLQSLPGIPSAAPANLEEIRRAYHTADRILRPSEQMALTVHGAGDAANYRAIDFSRFPTASAGVSNTVMGTEIPAFLRRGLTDFSNPAQNAQRLSNITAQRGVNVTPFNSQGINSIGELENNLENWFQTNRLDSDLLLTDFTSRVNNVRGRYNLGNSLESDLTDVVQGLSAEQKTNFINDLSTEITTLSPDELFMMRSNYGTRNLGTTTASKNYGRVNKSGLSKEEVVKQTSKEGKDALDKMSEEEFANTVLTPSGEILPYTSKQAEAVADIPAQEYSEIFNKDLKRLNEIIAGKNKSGVPYEVESLDPSGRLTFKTLERSVPRELTDMDKAVITNAEDGLKIAEGDHATMLENNLFANADEVEQSLKGIEEYKTHIQNLQNRLKTEIIPEGTKSWGVGIKPGKWTGEVENIPSQEYYKSIPGLSISNSMSGVFADGVVRRGSGAYEAVNDYLKELNLGRVKPGFNSQTSYSKGLWENAVNKGKAMGYYGNPSVVYGSMKSLVPYIGVGGAAGGATLLANPWQQEPKGL